MKAAFKLGFLAVSIYLISLLVLLPADQVYAVIKKNVNLPFTLYQLDGSIWNGRAAVAIVKNHRLESITWEIKPMALLLGRAELALGLKKNGGHINMNVGSTITRNFYLHDFDMRVPVAEIESLVVRNSFGLTGDVIAQLEKVKLDAKILSVVQGTVRWNDAGVGGSSAISLGDFEISFDTTDDGIKGIIKDSGGPIQIDGILLLKDDGTYQLTASLSARDSELQQGLRFIGQPDQSGKVPVSYSGSLQLEKYLPFLKQS